MGQSSWLILLGHTGLLGLSISAPQDPIIPSNDVSAGLSHSTKSIRGVSKSKFSQDPPPASLSRKIGGPTGFAINLDLDSDASAHHLHQTIQKVYLVSQQVSNHSWEWGRHSEAILETHYNDLSVYSTMRKLPLSKEDGALQAPEKLLDFIDPILARRDPNTLPLVDGDGASGDPASLGTAVLVASATTSSDIKRSQNYRKLADDQLDWLLNHVQRSAEGAISTRNNELQFWADFVYMAPPFLAYYGAATSNSTILKLAYDQARLYRDQLQPPSRATKLWRHIIGGSSSSEDCLYWSTGNGWAAAGMMRVLATFTNLRDATTLAQTEPWRKDLAEWVFEIVNEVFAHQQDEDTGLIPNYMLTKDPKRNYPECSGTALSASAAYRLASLVPSYAARLPMKRIEKPRLAVFNKCINSTTGLVAPVVDPLDWNAEKPLNGTSLEPGQVSPEGEAFVILLYGAWKAYKVSVDNQT